MYFVGGCLWLEMNDDSLSKHKLPLMELGISYEQMNVSTDNKLSRNISGSI